MTTDELHDLHEQAQDLAYLALIYDDLYRHLSSEEWDALARETAKEVVELIQRKIDGKRERMEAMACES